MENIPVYVLNSHHREWFGFTTTNPQGVAAFDFAIIVSGCDQLHVCGRIHARFMHVEEHLTSWWLMFPTLYGLLL